MSRPAVSLVIPVFNEAANLPELIRRCVAVGEGLGRSHEIILVDDGSRDASRQILRDAAAQHTSVVAVLLNRNYGQHAAVMAGFTQSRGEVVVTLDADLQNPPEEIPKLLAQTDRGHDVVGSVRIQRQDSWFRRTASRLINAAVRKATGVAMNDYGCMLRAYARPVVDAVLQCHERSAFIPVLANSFAGNPAEVRVAHAERKNDESKYDIWKLIHLQFDLLTSMTTFPLRLLSLLGGSFALLGFLLSLLLLITRLVFGAQWAGDGVFTLFSLLFLFIGSQFLAMGLLGEYLGRVYLDVRARPRFFVQEIVGRSDGPTSPPPAGA